MKKLISFLTIAFVASSAFAAAPSTDRRSQAAQWGSAQRATAAAQNQVRATTTTTTTATTAATDQKKQACMSNNIGVGNTFVWASKYSDTSNYNSMVEDTENADNNICFVRVALKSSDSKINVSDIAPVYYPMGQSIVCGSWADSGKIKNRILDAKKSARTWGTVAGVVGGAGGGVGAMELFGNKMIGGKVEGQRDKNLKDEDLKRSQLLALKKDDSKQYEKFKTSLQDLQKECENDVWTSVDQSKKPEECKNIDYAGWLAAITKLDAESTKTTTSTAMTETKK